MCPEPERVEQLQTEIHADICKLVEPPTEEVPHAMALPAISAINLVEIALKFAPLVTDAAIKYIEPQVEAFTESHAAWVRQFVSANALAFAARLIQDLQNSPAPVPGPTPPTPGPTPTPGPAPLP